jgi:CheY-like chemotaxis protein
LKPSVLLIEDAEDIRLFISMVLAPFALVTGAPDGQSGLQLLENQHFDIIVTDLMMPGISGEQLVQKLVEATGGGIPVLVLSADKPAISSIEQKFPGVATLPKPFSPDALRQKVRALSALTT